MTSVVCNSGPLTHLWQIGLGSIFGVFEIVHLAVQVVQEVHQHVPLDQLQSLAGCTVQPHDVPQHEIKSYRLALPPGLTLQEADLATLALALRLVPDLVLTDDLAM